MNRQGFKTIVYLVAAVVASVGIIGSIVVLHVYRGADRARWDMTRRELSGFCSRLSGLAIAQGRIPGPALADAVHAMREGDPVSAAMLSQWPLLTEGRDAWGTPLIYRVDPSGKKAILVSAGPNKEYNGGGLDDICEEITIASNP